MQCGLGMGYLGGDMFNAFTGSMGTSADANGDTLLSVGEWVNSVGFSQQSELARFTQVYGSRRDLAAADTDADATVSPAEFLAYTGTSSIMYTEVFNWNGMCQKDAE